jgi:hypothetical protein
MNFDQLILTAHFCSVAIVVVQACYIWKLQDEIQQLESKRSAWADWWQMHRESMEKRTTQLPENYPHEFAAKTAAMRAQAKQAAAELEGK